MNVVNKKEKINKKEKKKKEKIIDKFNFSCYNACSNKTQIFLVINKILLTLQKKYDIIGPAI